MSDKDTKAGGTDSLYYLMVCMRPFDTSIGVEVHTPVRRLAWKMGTDVFDNRHAENSGRWVLAMGHGDRDAKKSHGRSRFGFPEIRRFTGNIHVYSRRSWRPPNFADRPIGGNVYQKTGFLPVSGSRPMLVDVAHNDSLRTAETRARFPKVPGARGIGKFPPRRHRRAVERPSPTSTHPCRTRLCPRRERRTHQRAPKKRHPPRAIARGSQALPIALSGYVRVGK